MCLHVYVCVLMCMQMHGHMCVHTYGGLRVVLEMFCNHFCLILQSRVSQSNLELTNTAHPASQLTLWIPGLCLLRAGITVKPQHPCGTYMGSLLLW